ncbi:hypothetical protein ACQUW5_13230 [Legionella sp. CNM-1927-20]|uniref:hypothetical protein n=1 Tax=Legionella sp. CNM-1927-20 TaxID=3422221 RepID=UPI00403B246A
MSNLEISDNDFSNPKEDSSHYLPDFWLPYQNISLNEKTNQVSNYKIDFSS